MAPRIRTIKPEFFDDPEVGALPVQARLLFIGLWNYADREGRLKDRPAWLRIKIYPFDQNVTDSDVDDWLAALEKAGFISRYTSSQQGDGGGGPRRFLTIQNFLRHQIPGRDEPPSEIPGPDGVLAAYDRPPNVTVRNRIYQRDEYRCVYCGRDLTNDVRARCIDHVVPYVRGGTNTEQNLVTACKSCNTKKMDRTPLEAGLPWPKERGEQYVNGRRRPVNGALTGGRHFDGRKGKGKGKGKGNRETEREEKNTTSVSAGADAALPVVANPAELVEIWNQTVTNLPQAVGLSADREEHTRARLKEQPSRDVWLTVFRRMDASPFCQGQRPNPGHEHWHADFDFAVKRGTWTRVLEGKYDDRSHGPPMGVVSDKTRRTLANAEAAIRDRVGVGR